MKDTSAIQASQFRFSQDLFWMLCYGFLFLFAKYFPHLQPEVLLDSVLHIFELELPKAKSKIVEIAEKKIKCNLHSNKWKY